MATVERTLEARPNIQAIQQAVDAACKRIAPTWPLDRFIAVNPYWGFVDVAMETAACRIESYSGSRMLMPRSFYREQLREGSFRLEHLQQALFRSGLDMGMPDLLCALESEPLHISRVPLATFIADEQRDLLHGMSISDFLTHNVSQHCASYFDHFQSSWVTQHKADLYQSWLHHARTDRSPWLLMGLHNVRHHANSLPDSPLDLIARVLQALPVPESEWEHYLTALLMSINGWASWCAYERWQARLAQRDDDHIIQLLAIRLGWEHFVFTHLFDAQALQAWKDSWEEFVASNRKTERQHAVDWVFQEAHEISYQTELCRALKIDPNTSGTQVADIAAVQAVFCIDVRSEVFRRALEASSTDIQTLGFAGFFGLPIAYAPLGSENEQPQLPGLLAPKIRVSESTGTAQLDQQLQRKRHTTRLRGSIWKEFRSSATSTFTFVESCGFFFAGSLLKKALPRLNQAVATMRAAAVRSPTLRPCLSSNAHDAPKAFDDLCDLIFGILTNMSLTANYARLLLLVGHGSETTNNPHAAGLDCGACGGQSGEVNARLLASLLNDNVIRTALLKRGIAIPATTYVLAALHNTTTDEITIFDIDTLPATHATDLVHLQDALQRAGHLARSERASSLGIHDREVASSKSLLQQFQNRSRDWSQVRPEWGLANNAAFLIAPRSRTRGIDLEGRVFLHEYQSGLDPNGTVLEAIMTAPMLVTNWINMQYYASTVDNRLYGSGNKVLHNVVGGRLGVFEGNGGDLRIGLPLQSLHDGQALRHTPLRLSVFIEAPANSIDAILSKHEVVRNLVHHGWLHLFQIVPGSETIRRYRQGFWTDVP